MTNPVTHKVVSGDTLYSLAKKYGLTVNELKSINKLTSDTIKIGQILKLIEFTHTVISGDTLYSLAKKNNTTVETLKSINGLKNDVIKVGQILRLPEKYGASFILQDEHGNVLRNLDYEIELSDSSVYSGITDSMGLTSYIEHTIPLKVVDIRVFARVEVGCCAAPVMLTKDSIPNPFKSSDLPNIPDVLDVMKQMASNYVERKTRNAIVSFRRALELKAVSLAKGVTKFTIQRVLKTRNLHPDEETLIQTIFKNSINTELVKIHKGEFIGWIQDNQTAMTPAGEIYFPDDIYQENYTKAGDNAMHLFIHEMVHVWQYQHGYLVEEEGKNIARQGGYVQGFAYKYDWVVKRRNHLSDFNMEQQADIIADDYMYNHKKLDYRVGVSNQDRLRILREFKQYPDKTEYFPLLPKTSNLIQTVLGFDNGDKVDERANQV